ncbi:hypothetical protein IU500_19280 [Nocardia terpenica]|uniref:hypothetical protein n=1 Tax=Nocardia terpenica TaxID=455432 RepID=UPI0018955255|nr:hypothetical protein [Nocardia terpenica]MBF6062019.1 hypothetical protein [Nocardia terpenica]MBF6106181.1 hypothetical protein [Nocardia terpenica]MBF6110439.1 hypothetical protein [Nocardia terpenica]MBF6120724.1 hypothetical protein [Nocardia terpenica]MBF6151775.1 hypothetical protein [Nocardia terpenica]
MGEHHEPDWGPIRRNHATNGWQLIRAPGEYWLEKAVGDVRAIVRADTVSTCFWSIGTPDKPGLRVGGLRVEDAIAAAEAWLDTNTADQPDTHHDTGR